MSTTPPTLNSNPMGHLLSPSSSISKKSPGVLGLLSAPSHQRHHSSSSSVTYAYPTSSSASVRTAPGQRTPHREDQSFLSMTHSNTIGDEGHENDMLEVEENVLDGLEWGSPEMAPARSDSSVEGRSERPMTSLRVAEGGLPSPNRIGSLQQEMESSMQVRVSSGSSGSSTRPPFARGTQTPVTVVQALAFPDHIDEATQTSYPNTPFHHDSNVAYHRSAHQGITREAKRSLSPTQPRHRHGRFPSGISSAVSASRRVISGSSDRSQGKTTVRIISRKRIFSGQLARLKHAFSRCDGVLNPELRARLAHSTRLSEREIEAWFESRRAKLERLQRRHQREDGRTERLNQDELHGHYHVHPFAHYEQPLPDHHGYPNHYEGRVDPYHDPISQRYTRPHGEPIPNAPTPWYPFGMDFAPPPPGYAPVMTPHGVAFVPVMPGHNMMSSYGGFAPQGYPYVPTAPLSHPAHAPPVPPSHAYHAQRPSWGNSSHATKSRHRHQSSYQRRFHDPVNEYRGIFTRTEQKRRRNFSNTTASTQQTSSALTDGFEEASEEFIETIQWQSVTQAREREASSRMEEKDPRSNLGIGPYTGSPPSNYCGASSSSAVATRPFPVAQNQAQKSPDPVTSRVRITPKNDIIAPTMVNDTEARWLRNWVQTGHIMTDRKVLPRAELDLEDEAEVEDVARTELQGKAWRFQQGALHQRARALADLEAMKVGYPPKGPRRSISLNGSEESVPSPRGGASLVRPPHVRRVSTPKLISRQSIGSDRELHTLIPSTILEGRIQPRRNGPELPAMMTRPFPAGAPPASSNRSALRKSGQNRSESKNVSTFRDISHPSHSSFHLSPPQPRRTFAGPSSQYGSPPVVSSKLKYEQRVPSSRKASEPSHAVHRNITPKSPSSPEHLLEVPFSKTPPGKGGNYKRKLSGGQWITKTARHIWSRLQAGKQQPSVPNRAFHRRSSTLDNTEVTIASPIPPLMPLPKPSRKGKERMQDDVDAVPNLAADTEPSRFQEKPPLPAEAPKRKTWLPWD